MQKFTKTAATLALLGLVASGAHAQTTTITAFNFNDASTSGTTAANAALLFSVDRGNGVLTSNFPVVNVVSFGGTTVNADAGDLAGAALALQGGTGAVTGGTGGNNGDFLQLNSSTVGFTNIVVSFAAQATATGFSSDQFQYSTDGTTFINFGDVFKPQLSFSVTATPPGTATSFDLSSISGLNNNPNAAFRLVLNGATTSTGNIRIDNLLVQSVIAPEPSSVVSMFLGAGVLGLIAARRRTAKAA